jgi:hypothetical protein
VDFRSAATGRVKKIWLSRVTFAIVLRVLRGSGIAEDAKDFGKNDSGKRLADRLRVFELVGMGQGKYISVCGQGGLDHSTSKELVLVFHSPFQSTNPERLAMNVLGRKRVSTLEPGNKEGRLLMPCADTIVRDQGDHPTDSALGENKTNSLLESRPPSYTASIPL